MRKLTLAWRELVALLQDTPFDAIDSLLMDISDMECPNCGSLTLETPEADGSTRCAACDAELNILNFVDGTTFQALITDDTGQW